MKKFNSQAEAHSKLTGSPLASSGTYFFLFLNRLQAQAHSGPGSTPRASRTISKNFLFFISRLQAQAQARSSEATRHAQFY
jgi:hypothetical protein